MAGDEAGYDSPVGALFEPASRAALDLIADVTKPLEPLLPAALEGSRILQGPKQAVVYPREDLGTRSVGSTASAIWLGRELAVQRNGTSTFG